ncbi:DUF899 domain-containing protein [Pendulispora albinea]|uniref:DUF899 domain-containing protein n=1 Tax=Pendulispora albinea TaxID=2741071 RepID=A0ABZ2LMF4_9BACT
MSATPHRVVSEAEWIVARKKHLEREQELTRALEAVARERRELPWVAVEKNYVFDGPEGEQTLSDLFAGRSQLIVQHFMFGPGWKEGCPGCSFQSDNIGGAVVHLEHHDVSFVVVSRASVPEIEAFKKRMGWRFAWVSSGRSDFNYDYHVSFREDEIIKGKVYYNYELRDFQSEELPGVSAFYRDPSGAVFHTYSAYGGGADMLLGAYHYLDLTARGRNENGQPMGWVRHHDRYE